MVVKGLEKRVKFLGLVSVISVVLLMLHYAAGIGTDYLGGISIGMFAVIIPFFIFTLIKSKNREFKEDYNLSVQDERVMQNCNKAEALAHRILSILIVTCCIISYVFTVDLYFMAIGCVIVTKIFSKVYGSRLNKAE